MHRTVHLLILCAVLVVLLAQPPCALAREGEGDGQAAPIVAAAVAGLASRRATSKSSGGASLARARAIGKGSKPASASGGGDRAEGLDQQQPQQQQQPNKPQQVPSSASAALRQQRSAADPQALDQQQQNQVPSSSSSSAAATRQQRVRSAGAAGSGAAPTPSADYTYTPVDGRVLLRPRSINKLRDYAADIYGGLNEIAQAQPFFAGASVSGRVGLAARYNLDYSDYLSPRQINARIGPTSHVATAATGRAQGTAGFKAATDSVATRRASYRLDVADGMNFETGSVSQRLNAASAHATVERDQANDPFYATVADPGAGLVGKKRRSRRRAA
jgi:hypothetical protein